MRSISRPRLIIHRKIGWLLLFSLFSLALVSWLIYISERSIERTNFRINQTYEIIGITQRINTAVAEPGPGALLFLDSLEELDRDNNDQRGHIGLLRKYLIEKKEAEEGLRKAAGLTGIDGNGIGGNGIGRIITLEERLADLKASIGKLLQSMVAEETALLANRKELNKAANRRTAYGLIAGRIGGFIFVVIILIQLNKDISRRKETQEQLVQAIREAQDAKQMQEQFLANMSHEIRTPMNGIKGMTDLLLGTPLSGKQHELAGIIKSSVNNLLVIINDILDFSKIKAGKLNIEKIDFRLKEAVNAAVAIFEHRLRKKGLSLHIELDNNIPDRLIGDPHRLNQVLTNLLGNAVKFTDQGQVSIRVTLQKRSAQEAFVSFTITDTGIGIPEESLPHIFDSFSQAGQDISRKYGGTGLGLTICKQLLHLQGGDIHATSRPGEGSAFIFTVPYGISDRPETERPAADVLTDYSNLLTGKSFLVAEDNEINQKLIDYVLRRAGGTVEIVNNGVEAIHFLKNGKIVDLIIMDLQMPEMDGYEATQYIRNDLHMQTPIIAMTATAMKGEQMQCLQSGMNEYMTKPFEFAELYKRISSLLS